MSGSITPGPSAGGRRRGARLRFWLLIAISSVWVGLPPWDMQGVGPVGDKLAECPECHGQALRMQDGSYLCPNGHRFRIDKSEAEEGQEGEEGGQGGKEVEGQDEEVG